jgi:hypothetical protein
LQKLKFLNFFFSHSIFAAFCAAALSFQTIDVLPGATHSGFFYFFVFSATLCSYNFHLLAGALYIQGAGFLRQVTTAHKDAVGMVLLSAAGTVYALLHLQQLLPLVAIAFAATALYSLPLLPLPFVKKLRRIGFLKTLLLALTWTYVTAYLPLAQSGLAPGRAEYVFLAHRFCFVLQICLIFDLRDVAVDKIKGLHSLATDITPRAASLLFYLLIAAFGVFTVWLYQFIPSLYLVLAFAMVQFAAVILFRAPQQYRNYFFYFFLADGLMILSAVFTGLVSI